MLVQPLVEHVLAEAQKSKGPAAHSSDLLKPVSVVLLIFASAAACLNLKLGVVCLPSTCDCSV